MEACLGPPYVCITTPFICEMAVLRFELRLPRYVFKKNFLNFFHLYLSIFIMPSRYYLPKHHFFSLCSFRSYYRILGIRKMAAARSKSSVRTIYRLRWGGGDTQDKTTNEVHFIIFLYQTLYWFLCFQIIPTGVFLTNYDTIFTQTCGWKAGHWL
jgi:hypothetical protein